MEGERERHTDSADLQAGSGEGSEGGLSARARRLGALTAGGTELDVEGGDAEELAALGDLLGGEHSGVRGGLVVVSLDHHTAGDSGVGFLAGEIGDVLLYESKDIKICRFTKKRKKKRGKRKEKKEKNMHTMKVSLNEAKM